MITWLAQQWTDASPEKSQDREILTLLALSGWAPLKALTCAKENYLQKRDLLLQSLLNLPKNPLAIGSQSETFQAWGFEVFWFLWMSIAADLQKMATGAFETTGFNQDCAHQIRQLSQAYSLGVGLRWYERGIEAHRRYQACAGINVTMLIESLLFA
jgi:hypothetical protein